MGGWNLIQFEKNSQDAHANIVFLLQKPLLEGGQGEPVADLEVKFAKQSMKAEAFPFLFSIMIFWFTAFKSCNSYNSASGWTVGTSQWLYLSAELCAFFQAVCQVQLWEVVPHQRAFRPDLNVGDSKQQRGWNTAWSWLQSLGHSKIKLKL